MLQQPIIFLFAFLLTCLAACEKDETGSGEELLPKQIELSVQGEAVVGNSNAFGIDLFRETAVTGEGNLMLSPLSASAALTMLLNGCEGDTHTQIRDMLGYPGDLDIGEINNIYQNLVRQLLEADPRVTLALANAIFYRQGFDIKPPFIDTMEEAFDARVDGLDFDLPATVDVINMWASDNTNKRIQRVISEISDEMVMFIMNALYFKGDWTVQFDESMTADRPFYLDDGSVVEAPAMTGKIEGRTHFGENYRSIELTYGRTNFSMVFIVPDIPLRDFYEVFVADTWTGITRSLDLQEKSREIHVTLPSFKFEYEKVLNDQLQSMGMIDAFDARIADLSAISDWDIFVSFVKQNTFVEVNEEGTEAAAVTTIGVEVTSIDPDRPPSFVIDQPFVFAIRERTSNTLLFIGIVANPLE